MEQALEALGLNEKEREVYLANLRIGSAPVQAIAKAAKLNRTSTYDILASLEQKGFISYTQAGGKRSYQATDPKRLFGLLKEKESLVKKALPQLQALKESVMQQPKVEVYMGVQGIKSVFEDLLNAKEFDCIATRQHMEKMLKYFFPHIIKRRIKLGIKPRLILTGRPLAKDAPYRIIKRPLKTAIYIYNGKIALYSFEEKEPFAILIEEQNFYDTQKILFEMLWESLPKPADSPE